MLEFQKPKNIGCLTWILLVLIKKKCRDPSGYFNNGDCFGKDMTIGAMGRLWADRHTGSDIELLCN